MGEKALILQVTSTISSKRNTNSVIQGNVNGKLY